MYQHRPIAPLIAVALLAVGIFVIFWTLREPVPTSVHNKHVDVISAVKTIAGTEEFDLPNCGGTLPLERSLQSQVEVGRSVDVGTKATTSVGEEVAIPEIVKLELQAEVEDAYRQVYDTARSRLDTITMKADKHTHVVYDIQWEKQVFHSTVSYVIGDESYTAYYTYTLDVPKIGDSREVRCPLTPTTGWTPEPTSVPLAPTPLPTFTPTLTPIATDTPTVTATPTKAPTTPVLKTPTPIYPPPVLRFGGVMRCNVIFRWEWPGTLAEDEYYAVRAGIGTPGPSVIWIKETEYVRTFEEDGEYVWEVAICRGDPSTAICEELAVSEQESFWYSCRPSQPTPTR